MLITNGQRVRLLFLPALLVLSLTLLALACGDNGNDDSDESAGDGNGAAPVTFDISMGDNFFEPNAFTVSPGQEVTFNLTNDGLAIHNMHIAGADNEYGITFCDASGEEPCSDPELFQPGDTGTLVWIASDESGEFVFRCDFHPVESTGTISVE